MVLDSIRELNHASPFQPYEIRMTSGQKYRVPHPDFILVSPKGSYVIVVGANERPHHLSTLLIEEVSPLPRRASRSRRERPRRSVL